MNVRCEDGLPMLSRQHFSQHLALHMKDGHKTVLRRFDDASVTVRRVSSSVAVPSYVPSCCRLASVQQMRSRDAPTTTIGRRRDGVAVAIKDTASRRSHDGVETHKRRQRDTSRIFGSILVST